MTVHSRYKKEPFLIPFNLVDCPMRVMVLDRVDRDTVEDAAKLLRSEFESLKKHLEEKGLGSSFGSKAIAASSTSEFLTKTRALISVLLPNGNQQDF